MLNQIHGNEIKKTSKVPIREAAFPKPFSIGLEFNAPVHGTWNIVHTGMLVPQSLQIYACTINCNRGVLMTAAEMDEMERFATITVTQNDILYRNMEKLLIEGTADIIQKKKDRPRMVLFFPSCVHHFLGTDLSYVYQQLEKRFPDICFARCFMDPTMQKHSMPPDVRLRREMYSGVTAREKNKKAVAVIGNNLLLDEQCEMKQLLRKAGITCYELAACKTYEDYLRQGESSLSIVTHANALPAARKLKDRLQIEYLYLPFTYDYEKMEENLSLLADALSIHETMDLNPWKRQAEEALLQAAAKIGKRKTAIDFTFTSRPLGLAKLLLEHGFLVDRIYLDGISKEEKKEFEWLKEHAPELALISTMHHQMRRMEKEKKEDYLALGQKAAYFTQTGYFVNTIEENGYYGYSGICRLAQDMVQACLEEKNAEEILPKKGLGCHCILSCENSHRNFLRNAPYDPCQVTDVQHSCFEASVGRHFGLKQTKVKMPIYTGDVSAAAAALYELGGMVIMHDASGCNSTYNSHDELRWYQKESLIYISGLNHIDAIMGNEERLITEITEAAADLTPRFLAIASTPIPYMMGTDFRAITKEIEKRTGIPCFFVPTNGTHSYIYGAGRAFLEYTKKMICRIEKQEKMTENHEKQKNQLSQENQTERRDFAAEKKKTEAIRVNLLGITPLDFARTPVRASLEKWLKENGLQPGCCFAMDCVPDEMQRALEADVNLVVSSTGLEMAVYLEKETGIPYVVGLPTGLFSVSLLKAVKTAARTGKSITAYAEKKEGHHEICIVGEPVMAGSLACAIQMQYHKEGTVLVPVSCPQELLMSGDCIVEEEEELERQLGSAAIVIADEMLRPLCSKETRFYPLPHVACSGRIYADSMPDLITVSLEAVFMVRAELKKRKTT